MGQCCCWGNTGKWGPFVVFFYLEIDIYGKRGFSLKVGFLYYSLLLQYKQVILRSTRKRCIYCTYPRGTEIPQANCFFSSYVAKIST